MTGPVCLQCGKPIKKLMRGLSFVPATANYRQNGDRSDNGRTIYLDEDRRPRTKEEAQQYTNHEVLRITTSGGGAIYYMTWWEGEYEDRFFHSQTCAATFGRRAAGQGVRFDAHGINLEEIFSV